MSTGSTGWRPSEVNDSANLPPGSNIDYRTANYALPGDSTSSGGYGSAKNPYSPAAQRGRMNTSQAGYNTGLINQSTIGGPTGQQSSQAGSNTGLIDQSTTGGSIGQELDDAKQGRDAESRQKFQHEAQRDFAQGLNPYGRNPDNTGQAEEMLADKYNDARGRQFESGGAASLENDAGVI
ncbi:hypothetical protein OBBRIDRAFT_783688 [Obba rivulosa]|uniref:Uncharacterized protein n=1 Tax=Obba rivulosa TaxID=1052685 RepID=A0A8E2APV1_9APHY|nr:hypothetical protein OBBRIDRAFT_783688 [Obba rivulosa]